MLNVSQFCQNTQSKTRAFLVTPAVAVPLLLVFVNSTGVNLAFILGNLPSCQVQNLTSTVRNRNCRSCHHPIAIFEQMYAPDINRILLTGKTLVIGLGYLRCSRNTSLMVPLASSVRKMQEVWLAVLLTSSAIDQTAWQWRSQTCERVVNSIGKSRNPRLHRYDQ